MPRQLKPLEVGIWENPNSGERVTLYLNRNHNHFFAEPDGQYIHKPSVDELKAELVARAEDVTPLQWNPVIEIEPMKANGGTVSRGYKAAAGMAIDRFYYAITAKGRLVRVDWSTEPERRRMRMGDWNLVYGKNEFKGTALKMPQRKYISNGKFLTYMEYDETLWQALWALFMKVNELDDRLGKLISDEESLKALPGMIGGIALLAAPQETASASA